MIFQKIDVSSGAGVLRAGENVPAVHSLNVELTSSDLLIVAELTAYLK